MIARTRIEIGRFLRVFGLMALAWLATAQPVLAQFAVSDGKTLYQTSNSWGGASTACTACHFSAANPPGTDNQASGHPFGANNPSRIQTAFATGGLMVGQFGNAAFNMTASDAYKLSLWIGQFKAPVPGNASLFTRSGHAITFDANTLLATNGNSGVPKDGGVSAAVSTNGIAPTVSMTTATNPRRYNISYNPGSFVGDDGYGYSMVNDSGPAVGASVSVKVYGVSNTTLTATAHKGINSANTFTVTSNDPAASNFTATVGGNPIGTAISGLSISASTGVISGTPGSGVVPGDYNVTISTTVNSAGANNGVAATKTLVLTVAGITSAATLNLSQNSGTGLPYSITAFPSASGAACTGTLPTGLSCAAGQITGVPTQSGAFPITISATAAGQTVSQALSISVGPVPVVTTTPAIADAPAIYLAGTIGSPFTSIQINASNGPINANSYVATGVVGTITGLNFSTASGIISGAPSVSGDFPVTLGASNVNGAGTKNIILRINSNVAPTITSAATATTVPVGSSGASVYQITANNGPITSYAEVAPLVLASRGLSLNTGTGLITSASPVTSGSFSATVSATNSGSLAGTKLVSFTINPTTAPVITSPTFVSLAVGVPIAPIQVVASNPPILAYGGGASLPAGLTLNTVTGVITGTPTTPGPISTVLTATNVFNTGSLTVPFNIGVPTPTACVMSVLLNTPASLDLKTCMFPSTTPTGVSVLATPQYGTVTVAGTVITYVPKNNYFGPDTLTAVGYFSGGGVSGAGTIAVTITGRPDPAQDPIVTAIVAAQSDTARRFASTQARNFQRRAESLHQSLPAAGGAGAPNLQFRAPQAVTESRGLAGTAADAVVSDAVARQGLQTTPGQAASIAVPVVNFVPRVDPSRDPFATALPLQISTAQGLDAVASGTGLKSLPFAGAVTSLLTSKSINLAQLVPSNGAPKTGETSFWMEGVVSFGKQDIPGTTGAVEFSTSGVSAGADRRINDQLILGLGVGFGRDKTTIGTDGSQNDGSGTTVALYGSYQPKPGTFIDGMLGIGSLDFDTRRYVAPINSFALGKRKGTQWFGSLTAGYEFNNNNILFSPYARLDYSSDTLQDSIETGAGAFSLAYLAQTNTSLQGTLGARAESIHLTSFGWAIPRIRAEYRHEFQSDRLSFFSYADQIGGPRYALNTLGSGRDGLVLGIGTDFVLRDGWTFGLDYQLNQSSAQDSSYALKFKITKDLDAKGLPRLVANYEDNPTKPIDVQVDAAYVFDDNVTRAKAGPDVMFDSAFVVNVGKTEVYSLSEQSRFILTGTLGGERFQNFNGLSHVTATVEGELQYRDSAEFDAPTFGLFGKLSAERYPSDIRNGYRATVGLSMRQPLTDRISLFGALSRNTRSAVSDVFTTQDTALRLNADYLYSDRLTVYATGEWRYGDIVSSGRPSLENISIAKVFRQDDAYPGGQFFAYKVEGQTVLTTLGVNYGLGPRDSLDFSWRMVTSTPSLRPAFVTSPQSYIANQLSLTYLVRF